MIYHIATREDWDAAQEAGEYSADSLKGEGFIHCSTAGQVQATANRFFRWRQDLVLLQIDENEVQTEIKYENLEGGTELFPHIYGTLPIKAAIRLMDLFPDQDGFFLVNLTNK